MIQILVCYECSTKGGRLTGHTYYTVPKLNERNLQKVADDINKDIRSGGHQPVGNVIFTSVTRLDS